MASTNTGQAIDTLNTGQAIDTLNTIQGIHTLENEFSESFFLQKKVFSAVLKEEHTPLGESPYSEAPQSTFSEEFVEFLLFASLMESWCEEKRFMSFLSDIVACPSYQKIIKMREGALPLILAQLRKEGNDPSHWFTALEAITGHDPVPESVYGNMLKMTEIWLSWAEENNVS